MDETIRKVTGRRRAVLASEIASRSSDPHFYAALDVLPNPDAVLRAMNRGRRCTTPSATTPT
ncbi:MAG: hypothetical protein M5U09_27910 [Gammaproteobacteria bacterium]|nr:hypothetical protein [Gammaproteobacteria bacterium]